MDRLYELGIEYIFGVFGDYNFVFLDDVVVYENLKWIGNCNELNVVYVVDGYVCIKGIVVFIIIFGVGELSVINGIVGLYVENVLVIKIMGMLLIKVMENGVIVYYMLGDGKFDYFFNMYWEIIVV